MALLASCAAHHTSLLRRPAVSAAAARLAPPRPLLLQRPVVRRLSTTQSAASSSTPPERPPASLAVAPCTGLVSLAFGDGTSDPPHQETQQPLQRQQQEPLQVDCALLWHASPVLRPQIEKICASGSASPGAAARAGAGATARVLVDGTAADWGSVLKLLQHTGNFPVVGWDNVASLLRLADKYDMAAVRKECAAFLVSHKNDMLLHEPLESPKNLLHAASLVERYLSSRSTPLQAALQEHVTPITSLLQDTLQPMHIRPYAGNNEVWGWKASARGVVADLNKLVRHPRYRDIVTVAVQDQVQKAAMAALEALTCSNV